MILRVHRHWTLKFVGLPWQRRSPQRLTRWVKPLNCRVLLHNSLLKTVDNLELHSCQLLDTLLLGQFLRGKILLHPVIVVVNALNMPILIFVSISNCLLVLIVLILSINLVIVELARIELGNRDVARMWLVLAILGKGRDSSELLHARGVDSLPNFTRAVLVNLMLGLFAALPHILLLPVHVIVLAAAEWDGFRQLSALLRKSHKLNCRAFLWRQASQSVLHHRFLHTWDE